MTSPSPLAAAAARRVHVIDYHPTHLNYSLSREAGFAPEHPGDPAGDHTPAVGVHQVLSHSPGGGTLLWHEVPLSAWTATRAEFAAAPEQVRREALAVGPCARGGRWGTHLGATLAVVTADGRTVLRSRRGKHAEADRYDSLVAGTMLLDQLTVTTDAYLWALLAEAGVEREWVSGFHPTHLAMRTADFGLWIGGWVRLEVSADEVAAAAPFETVSVELDAEPDVAMTDWGAFDLQVAREHSAGFCALPVPTP